ncbi:baseplate protein [Parafrankia soli]|uniref:Baseplate protein n=1 Tax=Parafrankia soli TaxID=2599596 RepID=A0A1S1PSM2_9ACTN|nr:GPW/gp25 family protein [Parafrankia soli]OHV25758.1 baseplate protein [Parafrankia soli]
MPPAPAGTTAGTDFLGVGWGWPMATDASGSFAMTSGVDELEQAMYLILSTTPGERPMRPEFGCPLADYVFAPADSTTAGLIAYEVTRALSRWEPRVDVVDVQVTPDAVESTLWIDIGYRVRGVYDRRNLVVPFYVIPDEASS